MAMKQYDHQYIAELVRRCWNNDSDAFAELYGYTYDKVRLFCLGYLHDEELAKDAVQEVYITVFRRISTLSDPQLFIAWLNRIAFHTCYDMAHSTDRADPTDDALLSLFQDSRIDSNPETLSVERGDHQYLQRMISSLPELEKEVIHLRYFRSMKLEDVADSMGFSLSTAKRTLRSAQKHLKEKLAG